MSCLKLRNLNLISYLKKWSLKKYLNKIADVVGAVLANIIVLARVVEEYSGRIGAYVELLAHSLIERAVDGAERHRVDIERVLGGFAEFGQQIHARRAPL